MKKILICLSAVLLLSSVFIFNAIEASGIIKKGKKVKFDYTLQVDGKVVDTSIGKKPLEYTHGERGIIPGLSSGLEGLREGAEKKITVKPEDAYGERDPKAIAEVPKTFFPKDFKPQVGMTIPMPDRNGRPIPASVVSIKKDVIVLDFNHPLAGKTLEFDIKIISIE
ncbi:MAG: peptidylprolyl isomerase [Candidatus Omnitrophota bacterium]